jgi:uncharacterized membrane protein
MENAPALSFVGGLWQVCALRKVAIEVKPNLGTVDRWIRGVVGAILIAVGLLLVKGVIGVALGLLGAVLVFSGTVGFCHVYKFFHIGRSKRV